MHRDASTYDITKVDSSLRQLAEPFQSVDVAVVQDGGTLVIRIVDDTNKTEHFVFPAVFGVANSFDRLFVGTDHHEKPGAVEIPDPVHTKRMVIDILDRYSREDAYGCIALADLRGSVIDYIRLLGHRFAGHFDD
jgi:hypothetical protein